MNGLNCSKVELISCWPAALFFVCFVFFLFGARSYRDVVDIYFHCGSLFRPSVMFSMWCRISIEKLLLGDH